MLSDDHAAEWGPSGAPMRPSDVAVDAHGRVATTEQAVQVVEGAGVEWTASLTSDHGNAVRTLVHSALWRLLELHKYMPAAVMGSPPPKAGAKKTFWRTRVVATKGVLPGELLNATGDKGTRQYDLGE